MSRVRKFGEWRCRLSLCGTLALAWLTALAAVLMLPLTAPVDGGAAAWPASQIGCGQAAPRQNARNDRPPNADGGGGAQNDPAAE